MNPVPAMTHPTPIGIGLRQPHYSALFATWPHVDFLEVHAENFFALGGAAPAVLHTARTHYPVSLHSVGLGLGSATGLDLWHLDQLARLTHALDPLLVSDHACFARGEMQNIAVHGNDLLPIRFTRSSLDILCANVTQVQDRLQRAIAVENLSAYFTWEHTDYSEVDFLNALTQRTGCGLLLDVNNLYVNASNTQHNEAARMAQCMAFITNIRPHSVMEMHVAGFSRSDGLVIDDHASCVHDPVWTLYAAAQTRFAGTPTVVEWDLNLPELPVLLGEAAKARVIAQTALQTTLVSAVYDQ
jgi:uncharacterized protein